MIYSLKKKNGGKLRSRRSRKQTRIMKGGFKIRIKTIIKPKKYKELEVNGDMTIAALKTQIAKDLSLPSVRIMLVIPQSSQLGSIAGKELRELSDENTLTSSGVIEGSELEIIPRMLGTAVGEKDISRAVWS
jgi:hypothetical protein